MAYDHPFRVGIEFGEPGGHIAHRHMQRAGKFRDGNFLGLTDIQNLEPVLAREPLFQFDGTNFASLRHLELRLFAYSADNPSSLRAQRSVNVEGSDAD